MNSINIAKHRKAAGLTQPQLGEKLGVGKATIRLYEKAPERVGMGRLKQYAEACNVTLAELLDQDATAKDMVDAISKIIGGK